MIRRILAVLNIGPGRCLALLAGLVSTSVWAQIPASCDGLHNTYGPFDYRTANKDQRRIVENAHFTYGVESLTSGATGAYGGDISYTLAVFPNHHRALMSMSRLVEKERADPPRDAKITLECYFARALSFARDDLVVRMLYSNFLIGRKRDAEALAQIEFVRESSLDNAFTQFNVGMLLADLKEFDRALVQAHRAMELGFLRTDLKDRLVAAGKWREPAIDPAAAAASAAASAAPAASAP